MKKNIKVLSIIAAYCLTSQYGCVMAEDYSDNAGTVELSTMQVTGEGISVNDNVVTIIKAGDFTVSGANKDAMIYVNTDGRVKLRLSGVDLANSDGPAIFFESCEKGFITVTEGTENYISDGTEYNYDAKAAIFSNDDLEIKGNGTLTVTGNYKHAIASDDDIKIENSVLYLTAASDGIHVNNTFEMTGGTLNITAESDGIQAEEDVIIDGGLINVLKSEEGIESGTTLTINGGEINIVSSDDGLNSGGGSGEGGEFGKGFGHDGGFGKQAPPTDGTAPAEGQPPTDKSMDKEEKNFKGKGFEEGERPQRPVRDEGAFMPDENTRAQMSGEQNSGAEQTDKNLYINGGIIRISAEGDGVDSNADIVMTGGELYVNGPAGNGNGAIDCNKFTVSGGEVIAIGSSGMAVGLSQESEQCGIKVGFDKTLPSGTLLTLEDEDGNEIMSFTSEKSFSSVIYSSEKLTEGQTYTLLADGELLQNIEMSAKQVSVGNSGRGGFKGERGMRTETFGIGRGKSENANRVKVFLKGAEIKFDTAPVIKEDTTLVPLRGVFEALGMEVSWDEENSVIKADKDGVEIVLQIGNKSAKKNSEYIELTSAPIIENSRTIVPIRFIAESLDLNVSWDNETKSVEITE